MCKESCGNLYGCTAFWGGFIDRLEEAIADSHPAEAAMLREAAGHLDEACILFEETLRKLLGPQKAREYIHPASRL